MPPQDALAQFGVPGFDGAIKLEVLGQGTFALLLRLKVDLAPLARHQVEHVDEPQQDVVLGRRNDGFVEQGVELGQRFAALDRRRAVAQNPLQAVQIVRRAAQAGQAHGLALQHAAQLDRLGHFGGRQRHIGVGKQHHRLDAALGAVLLQVHARLGPALDNPQRVEPDQRLAHRAAAHTEQSCQVALGRQLVAGTETTFADQLQQLGGLLQAFHRISSCGIARRSHRVR